MASILPTNNVLMLSNMTAADLSLETGAVSSERTLAQNGFSMATVPVPQAAFSGNQFALERRPFTRGEPLATGLAAGLAVFFASHFAQAAINASSSPSSSEAGPFALVSAGMVLGLFTWLKGLFSPKPLGQEAIDRQLDEMNRANEANEAKEDEMKGSKTWQTMVLDHKFKEMDAAQEFEKRLAAHLLQRVRQRAGELSYGQPGQKRDWISHEENLPGIAAATDKGTGYKDWNEDRFAMFRGPDGSVALVAIDGVGGHMNGQRAAEVARAVIDQALQDGRPLDQAIRLADYAVQAEGQGGKAVVMGVRIGPRTAEGHPTSFYGIGDAEGTVFRREYPHVVFHTMRLNALAKALNRGAFQEGPDGRLDRGQTLLFRTMEGANIITASLGDGSPVDAMNPTAPLKVGDIVIVGSDGFFENFGSLDMIYRLIAVSGAKTPFEIRDVLVRETKIRMWLLNHAAGQVLTRQHYESAHLAVTGSKPPAGWRGIYEPATSGRRYRLEGSGEVKDEASSLVVDHFKIDNFTLVVHVVGSTETPPRKPAPINVRRPVPVEVPIRNLTLAAGPSILREMLQRKYGNQHKNWNIVVLSKGRGTEMRIADPWAAPSKPESRHARLAGDQDCLFAGTLKIEQGPPKWKLILTRDDGDFGNKTIRVNPNPKKIAAIKKSLAARFKIRPDQIEYRSA